MRQANTTFVNLRATLDDVDPLVEASKPVVPILARVLDELRPLARDARPTIRDLARTVGQPGRDNDLLDLMRTFPPLASAALDTKVRRINFGSGMKNLGETRGSFPETIEALEETAPIIRFGRPYTPDLFGWFDDFSTTGPVDAEGGFSRVAVRFNAFDLSGPTPTFIPLGSRGETFSQFARVGQFKRCPGHAEERAVDGSNVYTAEEMSEENFDCVESSRATGPVTNSP
jgi:phospholipid/cholesterol/gamma-HCH transport system substrate-binding protein